MALTLCVAFGTVDEPAVWAAIIDDDWEPAVGMRAEFHVKANADDVDDLFEIVAQVMYISEVEDGSAVVYLFGGEDLPDESMTDRLEANSWTQLESDEAHSVMEVVSAAPPTAAAHDVLLVVGDPFSQPDGSPVAFQAWNRMIAPEDPLLPMFGQRLVVDLLDSVSDDALEPDLRDDGDSVPFRVVIPVDPWTPGNASDGVNTVVVYCAVVDAGVAQVVFWAPSLEAIDGFDLLAAGWEMLTEEDFDPLDFKLAERIELALKTELQIELDEDGEPYLTDFQIRDAAEVSPDLYDLLPPGLAEQCRFAAEMTEADDVLARWRDEGFGRDSA